MQWVRNGSRLENDECSWYGMGQAWKMMNAVGTDSVTPGLPRMAFSLSADS